MSNRIHKHCTGKLKIGQNYSFLCEIISKVLEYFELTSLIKYQLYIFQLCKQSIKSFERGITPLAHKYPLSFLLIAL